MRIGILTYHFSINFGAVLQCYALQRALKNLGYTVYIINYTSAEQLDNISLYRKWNTVEGIVKNLALFPFHSERKNRNLLFESFKKCELECTRRVSNIKEMIEVLNELNINTILVGSDQVWNPTIKDFDNIFFLNSINSVCKIAYSVSLGEAGKNDLATYKKNILNFDYVTVREKSAAGIIQEVCGKKPEISVDPTFLLGIDDWEVFSKEVEERVLPHDYVVCYFLNKKKYKENIQKAQFYAKCNGLRLVLIDLRVSVESIKAKGIIDVGPKEFLNYIYNSKVVITDSFHGTVFSILLNKPFYSINNNPKTNDTRRFELLAQLTLEGQYVTNEKLSVYNSIPNLDYSVVNNKLSIIKEYSLLQLQKICESFI